MGAGLGSFMRSLSRLEHFVVSHAAWRVVGSPAVGQGALRPGVRLGFIVFPPGSPRSSEADRVQLDKDISRAVGVASGAGRPEVPAIGPVAQGPMPAEPAGPAVLASHPHALDVSAV